MRAVNLLPRDLAKQKRITQQQLPAVVGAGLGVVVVGALALSFTHASGQLHDAQGALAAKQSELASTPKPVTPPPPPNSDLAGEQSARLAAVSTALGARLAWDRVLREFSLVLPDDVWVSSLTLQAPDPTQAASTSAPTNFTLTGYTYSHDGVARLLARLGLIPELSGITLMNSELQLGSASSTPAAGSVPGTVQFTIQAGIQLPPGATSVTPPPPAPAPPPTTDTSTDAGASS